MTPKNKSLWEALFTGSHQRRPISSLFVHHARNNFNAFATLTMIGFGIAGYVCLNLVDSTSRSDDHMKSLQTNTGKLHNDEQLRQMILDAKSNDWKQNLETAYEAQKHFVLGPDHVDTATAKPKVMHRIEKRIEKIKQQSQQLQQQQQSEQQQQQQQQQQQGQEQKINDGDFV